MTAVRVIGIAGLVAVLLLVGGRLFELNHSRGKLTEIQTALLRDVPELDEITVFLDEESEGVWALRIHAAPRWGHRDYFPAWWEDRLAPESEGIREKIPNADIAAIVWRLQAGIGDPIEIRFPVGEIGPVPEE